VKAKTLVNFNNLSQELINFSFLLSLFDGIKIIAIIT